MSPLILDGYIIAVDTSDVSRDDLVGQIVVARNTEEKRLLVSRLIRFDHTDALVSDQREHAVRFIGQWIFLAHHWQGLMVDWKSQITPCDK